MSFFGKICLINIGGVIFLALLFSNFSSNLSDGPIWLGSAAITIGGINTFAGLILLFHKDKKYAQACLINGGLLLLIGFVTCSPYHFLNN